MMELRRIPQNKKEISIVPLVNVVFLLLIYFLVAGSLERVEIIPIDPPVAESSKIVDEGHIVILMGQYEELIVDDELVTPEELVNVVSGKLARYPGKIITLKADARIPANRMIHIMDKIKEAGGRNISLVTQTVS